MSIKRIGYALTVIGVIVVFASILVDHVKSGSSGIGVAQLLGIESGIILILLGTGMLMVSRDRIEIEFRPSVFLAKILDSSMIFWVVFTFVIVYFFFFIQPMFWNSKHQMIYFNRYLPNTGRIGLDIRVLMEHIENWLVLDQSPYSHGTIIYPPLTLILFSPLLLFEFPFFYKLITFFTLASYVITTLFIPLALTRRGKSISIFLFTMGLFSYGLQFELERGQSNLIAFGLSLVSIYIFYKLPKLRYIAYILFSISVQIKVYPAIFILLFIDGWQDWKTVIKRIFGIVLLNIAFLFVLGGGMFQEFVSATLRRQFASTPWQGSSISSFIYVMSNTGFGVFSEELVNLVKNEPGLFKTILMILFFICLGTILVIQYVRQMRGFNPYLLLACTIGIFIIPSESHDYKLPLLIAPVSLLLSSLPLSKNVTNGKKITHIISVIVIGLAFWSTFYTFKTKPEILQNNMPVLMVILISTVILCLSTSKKTIRT